MSYTQFLAAHPELDGLDEATKDLAYSQYLEQLNLAIEQLEEE